MAHCQALARKSFPNDSALSVNQDNPQPPRVSAGKLPPWTVGDLPRSPSFGWRSWAGLLGPGVLLAGASIGSGEWLAGPGVTAQYGGTLLWVAALSIFAQVFCNLEFMRYTLYCGEPIMVGGLRTRPGPKVWSGFYALLEFAHLWPYNVAGAAVAVSAAWLGHLPGEDDAGVVKFLGCTLFVLAFLPLIFGGTVYKTLERIMTVKLVYVLIFFALVGVFLISGRTAKEVVVGFFRFGQIPLRAETIIDGRHFTLTERDGDTVYRIRGTVEAKSVVVTRFRVGEEVYGINDTPPAQYSARRAEMVARATELAKPGRFFLEQREDESLVRLEGSLDPTDRRWVLGRITVVEGDDQRTYTNLTDLPSEALQERVSELTETSGQRRVQLVSYIGKHGKLPDLDWALIATFASIAGAGGLANVLFSNYARDKGWGMGARVGAIPSAFGGKTVSLSHVGQVFRLTEENRSRWRGWMRHIVRDQVAIWMVCCFVGMAIPCMMSIEFIRNAPVAGIRVAAMTADGIAHRLPGYGLWTLTLIVGFLILYPGQVMSGDTIPRRWCDILWTASARVRRLGGGQVKYIYYGLMAVMGVWGFLALLFVDPLSILKISGVLQNVALGSIALHSLFINRKLLHPDFRPNWFQQAGVIFCAVFFFGISTIVVLSFL